MWRRGNRSAVTAPQPCPRKGCTRAWQPRTTDFGRRRRRRREREYCMFKTYSVINRLLFPLIEIRHNLSPTPPFHVRTNLLSATICPLCPVSTTTSDLHRSVRRRRGGGVHFAVGDLGYVRALLVTICKQCCTSPPPPACTSEHVRVFVVHRLFFSRPGGRTVDADGRGWITFIRRHQQKKK